MLAKLIYELAQRYTIHNVVLLQLLYSYTKVLKSSKVVTGASVHWTYSSSSSSAISE